MQIKRWIVPAFFRRCRQEQRRSSTSWRSWWPPWRCRQRLCRSPSRRAQLKQSYWFSFNTFHGDLNFCNSSGRLSIGPPLKPVKNLPFFNWNYFFLECEQSNLPVLLSSKTLWLLQINSVKRNKKGRNWWYTGGLIGSSTGPDGACSILISKKQIKFAENNIGFIWDKCCHLLLVLCLMEPH